MASSVATDAESSEPVQAPRRRKCKNHLVQLAEMFPDVAYHVVAVYGSADEQIYVMEVKVGQKVIKFLPVVLLNLLLSAVPVDTFKSRLKNFCLHNARVGRFKSVRFKSLT